LKGGQWDGQASGKKAEELSTFQGFCPHFT